MKDGTGCHDLQFLNVEFKYELNVNELCEFNVEFKCGSPVKLFKTLKDEAIKALHSVCQQIWKTQ